MELPFHLKALPPEALDVIRFFGTLDEPLAHADFIASECGLSERLFGKVIRRLVTKGYVQMAGDQSYRLTDQGASAVDELASYDETAPAQSSSGAGAGRIQVRRRLVLVAPRTLIAGVTSALHVGFNAAENDQYLSQPADLVVRLSLVNGEPARPQEESFTLGNDAASRQFKVTPGRFTRLRVRITVFQLGPNPDDIGIAGGMYVDFTVIPPADLTIPFAAYGADVVLTE